MTLPVSENHHPAAGAALFHAEGPGGLARRVEHEVALVAHVVDGSAVAGQGIDSHRVGVLAGSGALARELGGRPGLEIDELQRAVAEVGDDH
jgi:hypothetical protein